MFIILKCRDCLENFEFSKSERAFYNEKGWKNPIRCKKCREKKKQIYITYHGLFDIMHNRTLKRQRTKALLSSSGGKTLT